VGTLYFIVHFYTDDPLDESFVINISYEQQQSTGNVALYITIIFIILVCLVSSVCFYRCLSRSIANRNRRNQAVIIQLNNNANNNINYELTQQELLKKKNNEILTKLFESELKPIEYADELNYYKIQVCSICLDNLSGAHVSKLSCNHIFHSECLKDWLFKDIIKPKCPNCNYFVIDNANSNRSILPEEALLNLATNNPQNHQEQQSVLMNPLMIVVGPPEHERDNHVE
jgi:hypothetical protein